MSIKDFQHATAERILHIYKDMGRRRVLLADEVGLGKTFVAKEVINLVRKWHREELHDDFFKVVYICSNANIADQNIEKLGVANPMSISESRLSMQHLYITLANNENLRRRAQGAMPESIIPLTPSTSFRFFSAQGTANERALMYCIMRRMPVFCGCDSVLGEFLRCGVKHWQQHVQFYEGKIEECGDAYIEEMLQKLHAALPHGLTEQLNDCATNGCNSTRRAGLINTLRQIFAGISIEMLDPDLVIMDEFQRFSSLLHSSGDEQSMLASRFFDDSRSDAKILLLSATPYKPYSTLEELNTDGRDEHCHDFMKVMDFLFVTQENTDAFRLTWQQYSAALKRTDVTDLSPLLATKDKAQEALYGVMCRTERFNSGIIDDSRVTDVEIMPEDILSYAQCRKLMERMADELPGERLGQLSMEYVKSSPYLLSFMDRYELKKHIVNALRKSAVAAGCKTDALLLKKSSINRYRAISPAHGKLKYLHDLVFGERNEKKSHLLLWVPASTPYYKAGGPFESDDARQFSKLLLFSSWEMVPRMISVMMSYYAERYTFGTQKKQRYGSRPGEGRLRVGGPLLEYPCRALAGLFSPATYYGRRIADIRKDIRAKIETMLATNAATASLPRRTRGNARHILTIMQLLDGAASPDTDTDDLYIPANALDVLTDIAIASPAVCAYRLSHDPDDARRAGKAMVSVFNKAESAAVIDLIYSKKSNDDYYESVLDYCVGGNLQAVLDEYAHTQASSRLGTIIQDAIIDTSHLAIDTTELLRAPEEEYKKPWMRCHFAVPFIDKAVTNKGVLRTSNIRKAFNSPFRPFILSTTSIGQEGLDFHLYARRIVHWNLPSNPVDLEQREGRINRFQCLAIRRNVASLFASSHYQSWDELFELARTALKGNHSDMVPYWCLPVSQLSGQQRSRLQYIERIIPLYPLSRDRFRYEKLIKVLSLYRMTLGQPRQEELLQLLHEMHLSPEQLHSLTIDLCPFNKERLKEN